MFELNENNLSQVQGGGFNEALENCVLGTVTAINIGMMNYQVVNYYPEYGDNNICHRAMVLSYTCIAMVAFGTIGFIFGLCDRR